MQATWTTGYRKNFLVGAMSNDHIHKCIWAIKKGTAWRDGCNGFSNQEWLMIFNTEIVRRNRFNQEKANA